MARPARHGGRGVAALTAAFAAWLLAVGPAPVAAGDAESLWRAVRTGTAFAIMRHALAPGIGDPTNFSLGDCRTQRNLSERGRRQAVRIGERFRRNGIHRAHVFSSAWCRCRDTAQLLSLGPVKTLPSLNSLFPEPDRRAARTAALESWLAAYDGGWPLVLVTHRVNITALTGTVTGSGEIVVVRRDAGGTIAVLGTL